MQAAAALGGEDNLASQFWVEPSDSRCESRMTAARAAMLRSAWMALTASGLVAWLTTVGHAAPPAKKLPTAALFATAGAKSSTGPLDSVLQAALEKLGVVVVSARPGMDLSGVQLALDCVSESAQCLRAVAKESGVEVLIAPTLESTGSELVLSVLRFDVRDGQMRRVVRRQSGSSLHSATLDAVPSMLRELFGLPEPAPPAPVAAQPPAAGSETTNAELPLIEPMPDSVSHPMPVGPWILAGAGALVIGGGAVAGVMMLGTQDDYNQLHIRDAGDVREANALKDKAQTQATVANVLFGVGAATLVASGIWLAVELSNPGRPDDDWQTAVVPSIGPGQLGLQLVQRGSGL